MRAESQPAASPTNAASGPLVEGQPASSMREAPAGPTIELVKVEPVATRRARAGTPDQARSRGHNAAKLLIAAGCAVVLVVAAIVFGGPRVTPSAGHGGEGVSSGPSAPELSPVIPTLSSPPVTPVPSDQISPAAPPSGSPTNGSSRHDPPATGYRNLDEVKVSKSGLASFPVPFVVYKDLAKPDTIVLVKTVTKGSGKKLRESDGVSLDSVAEYDALSGQLTGGIGSGRGVDPIGDIWPVLAGVTLGSRIVYYLPHSTENAEIVVADVHEFR